MQQRGVQGRARQYHDANGSQQKGQMQCKYGGDGLGRQLYGVIVRLCGRATERGDQEAKMHYY
jgi:hypothetical protein